MARMRSRLNWLKEGDANTSYFQQHARYRKKRNFIAKIKDGDQVVLDQEGKKQVFWEYYNNLLGSVAQREFTLNLQDMHRLGMDLSDLELTITQDEVWATIKSIPSDKASGPDDSIK